MRTRGRNDHPVGGITMERGWKSIERENDLHVERYDADQRRRLRQPRAERQRQPKPPLGMKHLRFPDADRGNGQLSAFRERIQALALACAQQVSSYQPAQPDVRIEQDAQRSA
jgi:hypothetical protein